MFENDMTQGYQIRWWRMNQWRITKGDALQVLMCRSCWCADPADAPILLMRWFCWCADPADAPILLMRQSCWCTNPADAPILHFSLLPLKNADLHHFPVPKMVSTWNSLPLTIKSVSDLSDFRSDLKAHFLSKYETVFDLINCLSRFGLIWFWSRFWIVA